MAVWQFKFNLIPSAGIARVHGGNVAVIEEYRSSPSGPQFREGADFPNYWDPSALRQAALVVSGFSPEIDSWSAEARMFGDAEGDKIEVWNDEITCFVNMRNFSEPFVQNVLSLARRFDCKLVVHGSGAVIEPEMSELAPHIDVSDAYRFCVSPEEYLKSTRPLSG